MNFAGIGLSKPSLRSLISREGQGDARPSLLVGLWILIFVVAMATCSSGGATADETGCLKYSWSYPERPPGATEFDDDVRPTLITDPAGVTHLFVPNLRDPDGPSGYDIRHYILSNGSLVPSVDPEPAPFGESDYGPQAGLTEDGYIALTWNRNRAPGADGSKLLIAFYDLALERWSAPIVARDPVAQGTLPALAAVTSDSTWVFFRRGSSLRAKLVIRGIQGPEAVLPNLGQSGTTWRPHAIRRSSGNIWAFWSSTVPQFPLYLGNYVVLSGATFSETAQIPSTNGVDRIVATEDTTGRLWVAYIDSRNGRAASMMSTTDGSDWSLPERISGYDGGQDCVGVSLAPLASGQLFVVSLCEWPLGDGTHVPNQYGAEARVFDTQQGFCQMSRMGFTRPEVPIWNIHSSATIGADGLPIVAFLKGPQVRHHLVVTQAVASVGIATARIDADQSSTRDVRVSPQFSAADGPSVVRVYATSPSSAWQALDAIETWPGANHLVRVPPWATAMKFELYSLSRSVTLSETTIGISSTEIRLSATTEDGRIFRICGAGTGALRGLAVYNIVGRRVARIDSETLNTTPCTDWTARDERGAPLARGTYLLRGEFEVNGGLRTRTKKLSVR
jgi:hypothetical protein